MRQEMSEIALSNEPFFFKPEQETNQAFLLLHGLGGGVYEMRYLAERLQQAGYAAASWNYPGHDQPVSQMPASRWEDWYADIEARYAELCDQYERVSVVGFSTGCPLSLYLASRGHLVKPIHQLILLSPFLKIRHEWYYLLRPERYVETLGRWIQHIPRWRLPIRDRKMQALAKQAMYFTTFNIPTVRSALMLIKQVEPELEKIQTPALIIQSHQDRVVCPSGAAILMTRLGSKLKECLWLEQSDHIVLLDQERELVIEKILTFIQQN